MKFVIYLSIGVIKLKKPGKVITFYSFKGGVGRSMALSNIACLLAQEQKKEKGPNVLMIDWDLDAPGLHHFFRKIGVSSSKKGLMEFFIMLKDIIDAEIDKNETQDFDDDDDDTHVLEEEQAEKILDSVNFSEYVQQTDIPCLEILTCGSYDENYSSKVSNFNWPDLFNKAPDFFRQFAEYLTGKYQYVLIDSRTGYTDTSGICTMLMPEILVLVFTPNRQSITGAIEVLKKSADYRKQFDDLRPLVGFPIPTRIDNAELDRKNDWRMGSSDKDIQGYQPAFGKAFKEIYALQECSLAPFFDKVQIPYIPYYSYGETIAVLRESGDETNT
ncbi:MAG: AAA family ATPase, partial [Desulfobacteraceae bacterium]|nr:AAA family ATPase [Desulfobacteraceae bacterium]